MHPQKIAIIGVGLLGGSLALALRGQKGVKLVGWNHRVSSRKKAARLLSMASSFEEAVRDSSVVLLCAHSGSISEALGRIERLTGKNTLVMDVSSVKGQLVKEAEKISGAADHFVPCHPMAGKEKSGPAYADGGLYRGKYVFITPLPKSPKDLVGRAIRFWKKLGAVPIVADPFAHDRAVALTSHLPHLLASAYMDVYSRHEGRLPLYRHAVGSGFKDFTRISEGNPIMWSDILQMNTREIKKFLAQYRKRLLELEKNLKSGRSRYWISFFEKARAMRKKIQ